MQTGPFEMAVDPSDYMRRIATSPIGQMYKSIGLQQLGLTAGASVLDLGCGPGIDLLSYAEVVGGTGVVVGVDCNEAAVDDARQRTVDLPQVRLHHADIEALPLPDESFDAIHGDRVLQHVPDPTVALAEAVRVLKIGGRAVFAEPDWRTLIIDHPQTHLSDAFTRYVIDHQVRNARIGGQLSRLTCLAGLTVETVLPITSVYDDPTAADQVFGFKRVTNRAIRAGLISDGEGRHFLEGLAAKPFFASVTLFMVVARKEPPKLP